MGDEGPGSLDARFGAARAMPTRIEVQQLKASVRARLFGTDDTTRVGEFTIRRRLGRGGMGAVYEAVDPSGDVVALKTLRGFTPAMLYQLKHEFRVLAGVVHPNLVGLYKLFVGAEQAFFSMEMVRGLDFVAHVRGELAPGTFDAAAAARLRSALAQLLDGVIALHSAGKLHRDLKPSNVLVTAEGRVVVLDFGLVREISDHSALTSSSESFVGTPAYMPPELASGAQLGEAGDVYAIGVILHEALCGALPFDGAGFQVLLDKCRREAPDARSVAAGVPDELAELALALLRREPERRPGLLAIRRVIGGRIFDPSEPTLVAPPTALIGREEPLRALHAAFARASNAAAEPVIVAVRGEPGIGTSAILQAFAEAVTREHGALTLCGRCFASESVPFRAIDPLIDALTRWLLDQEAARVAALVPADIGPLVRIFPVLGRVPALAAVAAAEGAPAELQRRAFLGLRRLLAAIAGERPLVLMIDDLQWGDDDSAILLSALVRGPEAPAMTLIFGVAARDAGHSRILRQLRDDEATILEVDVGPLSDGDAAALARSIVGPGASEAEIAAVVADAAGSPLFVLELARRMRSVGEWIVGARLEQLVTGRVRSLAPNARRVLEIVAIAGRPIAPRIVLQAAGLPTQERAVIAALRANHLINARVVDDDELLEIHDRIREAVLAALTPEGRAHLHLQVAAALLAADAPAETLADHYRQAGHPGEALHHTLRAADEARAALALRRAAGLYAIAIELAADAPPRRPIHLRLAETLLALGRGIEAADHYFAAAAGETADNALRLRRAAAITLLRFGAAGRGIHALRQVVAAIGVPWPHAGALGALELAKERLRLRLRGLSFRVRPPEERDPRLSVEVETLAAAREGLSSIDPLSAMIFQTRLLRRALDLGDPDRISAALAGEAAFAAHIGGADRARVGRLLRQSSDLIREHGGDHYAKEAWSLCAGVVAFSWGRWRECVGHMATIRELDLRHEGSTYIATMRTFFDLSARVYLGDIEGLVARHPAAVLQAQSSGDLCAQATLRAGPQVIAHLVHDQLAAAREDLAHAARIWTPDTFTMQQAWAFLGERAVDAYAGDPTAAWGRLAQAWPNYHRNVAFAGAYLRIMGRFWRARAAIAAAAAGEPSLLAVARLELRELAAERPPWATPMIRLLRAGILAVTGRGAAAAVAYDDAARGLRRVDMATWASAAAWQRARILGGDEGLASARAIEAELHAQGVAQPARFMAMLAPGMR